MWPWIASFILRYRIGLLVGIAALTVFMGYQGRNAEVLQEFVKVVPADDPDYQNYVAFKETFGDDGNAVLIGIEGDFWNPQVLNALWHLSPRLDSLPAVERVLNLTRVFTLALDDSNERFRLQPVMTAPLTSAAAADSLRLTLASQPFYRGFLISPDQKATLCVVTLTQKVLVSKDKHALIRSIQQQVDAALGGLPVKVHYLGVPYLRSYVAQKLPSELTLFMVLAILVTALALLAFFRSFYAVIFPLILLGVSVVCTFGLLALLGYKIALITALIPPIIIILGIPPSIYMLSDYHAEYVQTGNKLRALRRMIMKLGLVTFMINANTAFGFLTLYFTNVVPLQEFGMLAFLSTLLTYVLTIILIPGVFALLPEPNNRRLRHLESKPITALVEWVVRTVERRRLAVYAISVVATGIGIWGMFYLRPVSYMVDDLPTEDRIRQDLAFLEARFKGIMPFEIVVDTKRKNGVRRLATLRQMAEAQQVLQRFPEISRTVSVADALSWSRQAFYGGDSSAYALPNRDELPILLNYANRSRSATDDEDTSPRSLDEQPFLANLVDSTYQRARISGFVKDIGSRELPMLLARVQTALDSVFFPEGKPMALPGATSDSTAQASQQHVDFTLTGTTRIFLKANDYLIDNLFWSLIATFVIIGLQMLLLFSSWRMMLVSLIPNLIPLVVTAGIMGWAGIELKPSTALIYGIAFGIAIDNSIHYLAAYRHKRKKGLGISEGAAAALRSTGMSIIYTSLVLFVGFVIFTPSAFGSTRALGVLTSVTLFVALFTNLLLMPALLLQLDRQKVSGHALIDDEELPAEGAEAPDAPVGATETH